MAWRSIENSIGSASGTLHEAGHGLMRITGGWGNFPGPGLFMIRTIIAGTTSAITIGLAGSGIAAACFGTASLPFLICACAGFVFGAVGWYRNAMERSLIALERNPRLMRLHLDANYPDQRFQRLEDRALMARFHGSWTAQSMLVCSWLTAQPAFDNLLEAQEQALTSTLPHEDATTTDLEPKQGF